MKKVLIIGHAHDMSITTKMLMDKIPDSEIISIDKVNKAFEPEPLKFELRNTLTNYEPVVVRPNKYSGEKIMTQRAERRKKNRDARKARR